MQKDDKSEKSHAKRKFVFSTFDFDKLVVIFVLSSLLPERFACQCLVRWRNGGRIEVEDLV